MQIAHRKEAPNVIERAVELPPLPEDLLSVNTARARHLLKYMRQGRFARGRMGVLQQRHRQRWHRSRDRLALHARAHREGPSRVHGGVCAECRDRLTGHVEQARR